MRPLDIYYLLKPAIPRSIRLTVRHHLAVRLRKRYAGTWPINESARGAPENWPGWPADKAFAFVLTHDVEGRTGMERCRRLAEMEMGLGVRSSFNFVPEGEYALPAGLSSFLTANGFEIGVHDLHHDGSLYRSYDAFKAASQRINHHLHAWGAVGFRSAFMLHNLEWLRELDVLYDASTFDTDPFEPQPDGVNTILPFWVPRENGSGYVELPYTLAQDSTLFLILRETGNGIWKHKLDWVSAHGGLALVNVHPDYIAFDGRPGAFEYDAGLYREFLQYAIQRYGSSAWFALPREVASFARRHLSVPHRCTPDQRALDHSAPRVGMQVDHSIGRD
jgi:hypothetical protein